MGLFSCRSVKSLTDENRIPLSNEVMTIDGQLKEESWDNAFVINQFEIFSGPENLKPPQTIVKLFHSSEGLYLSSQIYTEKINAQITDRDGPVYKDNCFEFFLDPGADGINYCELEINALGTVWDLILKTSNNPLNHPSNLKAWHLPEGHFAVNIQGTLNDDTDADQYWTAEIFIPWRLFENGRPSKNEIWKANFMRIDYTGGEASISVWKKTTGKNIHQPAEWGVLKF